MQCCRRCHLHAWRTRADGEPIRYISTGDEDDDVEGDEEDEEADDDDEDAEEDDEAEGDGAHKAGGENGVKGKFPRSLRDASVREANARPQTSNRP